MSKLLTIAIVIMLGGCSLKKSHEVPQIGKPDKNTVKNSKYDMYEVLLRHLFENNGSGQRGPRPLPAYWDVYISINDSEFDNEDELSMRFPQGINACKSPSPEFMSRFANDARKIAASPDGDAALKLAHERNIPRKGKARPKQMVIIFMIDGMIRNENGTITVMAAYYAHNYNAGTYRYVMKKEKGRWIVSNAHCTGIS